MLGEKLKIERERNNLSQGDVAKKLNISRQSISKWENNRNLPDLENLIRLGELYQTPIDILISEHSFTKVESDPIKSEMNSLIHMDENYLWILLILLCCFSAIIAPLGLVLIPFIVFKNRKNKTFKILIFSISVLCAVINLYQLYMIYGDHQKIGQTIVIEEIQ